MHVSNMLELFFIIDELYSYLEERNLSFDEQGLPVFTNDMFLNEWPNLVIPFSQRNNRRVVDKKKTVICFYDKDQKLYPRLMKVLKEID